jgi:thioesterase domain-containing protein
LPAGPGAASAPTDAVVAASTEALRRYRPVPFAGQAVLFQTVKGWSTMRAQARGWAALLRGGLTVELIEGAHLEMFAPGNLEALAQRLAARLGHAGPDAPAGEMR